MLLQQTNHGKITKRNNKWLEGLSVERIKNKPQNDHTIKSTAWFSVSQTIALSLSEHYDAPYICQLLIESVSHLSVCLSVTLLLDP